MAEIQDIWLHAHKMIRSARQIINENLRPQNLSSAEGNILLHLLAHNHEMRQEHLVEQLDISKPAVSRALDSLESKGYVIRQQDQVDRRACNIFLTDQARAVGPAVEQIYNQIYSLAVQGISAQELDQFVRLFGRMSENLARRQSSKSMENTDAT